MTLGVACAQPAQQKVDSHGSVSELNSELGMDKMEVLNNQVARFGWGNNNTTGWSLMTLEEHKALQIKMRTITTYEECKKLLEENHLIMEKRAKEKK